MYVVFMCACVCNYVCMYVCMYVCISTIIYMYTYTRKYIHCAFFVARRLNFISVLLGVHRVSCEVW